MPNRSKCPRRTSPGATSSRGLPGLRIIDLDGRCVAELSHGPGHGLSPSGGWSPVAGDARYLAVHDREDLERPLIFDAKTGTSNEIRLDLPGETFAD